MYGGTTFGQRPYTTLLRAQTRYGIPIHTDFEHATIGLRQDAFAVRGELAVPHRQIYQMRHHAILIETHRGSP
jgi:hypothetical protein